jgi:hypothetical protein
VTHIESHVGDVGAVGDEGKDGAYRRLSINDDVGPSPTRSVGEEKVKEAILRPPGDQLRELRRRQGVRVSGSGESSRAGTMVCRELLEVRELALGISEQVDLDWDRLINARPTRTQRTPVRLFDANGQQVQVQQPTAILPGDLGTANQDSAPEPSTVQPLSGLFVVQPNVRFLKVARIIGRKAQGRDLVRTNMLGSDATEFFLLPQPHRACADSTDGLLVALLVRASRDHLYESRCTGTQALDAPFILAFGVCQRLNASPKRPVKLECGLVQSSLL